VYNHYNLKVQLRIVLLTVYDVRRYYSVVDDIIILYFAAFDPKQKQNKQQKQLKTEISLKEIL